ncbi:MAG: hypothetical protein ACI9EZ_001516, partial [Halobacteriales archaeon]
MSCCRSRRNYQHDLAAAALGTYVLGIKYPASFTELESSSFPEPFSSRR